MRTLRTNLLALILVASGCTSSALFETTDAYYGQGPEEVVKILRQKPVRAADRHLAAMEEAVALQEMGSYAESTALLQATAEALAGPKPGTVAASLLVNDEAGMYRGESFERVYLHALAMSNLLALQDVEGAASEASRALGMISDVSCDGCSFAFTRYLAAISLASSGSPEAEEVMAEAFSESPDLPFLDRELVRLSGDAMAAEEGRVVLYMLLLLGKGPQKVEDVVFVPHSHGVAWPRYVPRYPRVVTGARLRVPGQGEHLAEELTDIEQLAAASLRSRLAALITKEAGKSAFQEAIAHNLGHDHGPGAELVARFLFSLADRADLRHWSSLPASCQVIRVSLPDVVAEVELLYTGPDGRVVDRELVPVPEAWTGPLFVVRRMP